MCDFPLTAFSMWTWSRIQFLIYLLKKFSFFYWALISKTNLRHYLSNNSVCYVAVIVFPFCRPLCDDWWHPVSPLRRRHTSIFLAFFCQYWLLFLPILAAKSEWSVTRSQVFSCQYWHFRSFFFIGSGSWKHYLQTKENIMDSDYRRRIALIGLNLWLLNHHMKRKHIFTYLRTLTFKTAAVHPLGLGPKQRL